MRAGQLGAHHEFVAQQDLDLASYGIVKLPDGRHGGACPDMTREPKAAFTALAECYRPR